MFLTQLNLSSSDIKTTRYGHFTIASMLANWSGSQSLSSNKKATKFFYIQNYLLLKKKKKTLPFGSFPWLPYRYNNGTKCTIFNMSCPFVFKVRRFNKKFKFLSNYHEPQSLIQSQKVKPECHSQLVLNIEIIVQFTLIFII